MNGNTLTCPCEERASEQVLYNHYDLQHLYDQKRRSRVVQVTMLLLYELVCYITVCLLAATGGGKAAPAIAEVRVPLTSGPCIFATEGTLRWNHEKQVLEVTALPQNSLALSF